MITFLVTMFQVIMGYPVPLWAFGLAGLLDGLVWFPVMNFAFFPFMGKTVRTMVGRLHYLQTAHSAGKAGIAFILGRDGYEFAPVIEDDEDRLFAIMRDGREVEIDQENAKVYQLARKPFIITFEPVEEVVGPYLDEDAEIVDYVGVGKEYRLGILNRTRNGTAMFTKYVTTEGLDRYGGFLVSLSKVISSFRGGGGTEVIHDTQHEILKTEGGDRDFSTKAMVMGSVSVIVFMSLMSLLVFGGFV